MNCIQQAVQPSPSVFSTSRSQCCDGDSLVPANGLGDANLPKTEQNRLESRTHTIRTYKPNEKR